MNNNFFKYLSVFLLGLILGYLLKGMNFSTTSSQISADGSIKILGDQNAPVTITEYSDFQCPLCKRFFDESYSTILKNYIDTGKVKYVFKHFPLNIHPQAPAAALAAECALEQNKFWEMHDELFNSQGEWSGSPNHFNTFKKLAQKLALNEQQFNQCLDSQKYQGNVNVDYQEALNKGFRGTPSFTINNEIIIGAQPTSTFVNTIEQLLQ